MVLSRQKIELQAAAAIELRHRDDNKPIVFGIVCPKLGLLYSLQEINGKFIKVDKKPRIYLSMKMVHVLKSEKRFIVVIGGRGSQKSVGVTDICVADARDNGAKTYCLREYMSSIRNSVYSLVTSEIKRHNLTGFNITKTEIACNDKPAFEFAGLSRNIDSIKSSHGFKRFQIEEGSFMTQLSLDALTATVRNKPKNGLPGKFIVKNENVEVDDDLRNVSMIFIANPGSAEDPFSKRFILPFIDLLGKNGIYEDELHLIVKMNYTDNPWFDDSGLDGERIWDKMNRSDAFYRHRWLGEFYDSVEDGLIMEDWFNACIDAHLKLGFKASGIRIAAHDPSDTGADSKGYAFRHGSVFYKVLEKDDGDANEGCHWAVSEAISDHADYFSWDCDGLGCSLAEQVSHDFVGKHTVLSMYKGSESPDFPDKLYKPAQDNIVHNQQKISDLFKNKRCQYYWELANRIYLTYRAVVYGELVHHDNLISFSSDIELIGKLRTELCRMPVKPNKNGFKELYTKQEMKSKFRLQSQNLGDSVVMAMRYINTAIPEAKPPPVIRKMGAI